MPESNAVATWQHLAAGWMVWALRGRSEALVRIERQMEVGSAATSAVVWR